MIFQKILNFKQILKNKLDKDYKKIYNYSE